MKFTTYRQAEEFLFSRSAKGMKLGLENIHRLMQLLNHPEQGLPAVHIAGTNGKGSTAAIMESVLRAAGYKTGLFTSPHLVSMRERIKVSGVKIPEKRMLALLNRILPAIEEAESSFFEILTAMSLLHFREEQTDIAVMETGLGGRLDATRVVEPVVTMITTISHDHTGILGRTLTAIVREKAGILKENVPCVTGITSGVVLKELLASAAPLSVPVISARDRLRLSAVTQDISGTVFDARTGGAHYRGLHLGLLGRHQTANAGLALLAVDALREQGWRIDEAAVRSGLNETRWPGRLQLIPGTPALLIDSAHNEKGTRTLVQALDDLFKTRRKLLVFGVLRDKQYRSMLAMLAPLCDAFYLTRPLNERAVEPGMLSGLPVLNGRSVCVEPDIPAAWRRAKEAARPDDLLIAAGSIYFVGDVLRIEGETDPAVLP
ncbi:bifunctional folylpolyglutamate synthase/dihydrofolate synthase [bacterium]|nr:bifunctional folylpolyglutamate synthase/dihydrofolate synthase [bacterium]